MLFYGPIKKDQKSIFIDGQKKKILATLYTRIYFKLYL